MPVDAETQSQPQYLATSKITIPINPTSSSSSSISSNNFNTSKSHPNINNINTEEFAKLDALLEDLLAEVEQPILLNKDGIVSSWNTVTTTTTTSNGINRSLSSNGKLMHNNGNNIDDIERSVDWLNEQKERLKSRKELVNNFSTKYNYNGDINKSYPRYKSKVDYFINNDNSSLNGNGVNTTTNGNNNNFKYDSTNGTATHCSCIESSSHFNVNKPPVSPTNRLVYSPTPQQQQATVQLPIVSSSFRSLSTNGGILKNINEAEDESNLVSSTNGTTTNNNNNNSEFDRFSQRSFRSNTNTVQRSKYHLVSNDYVDCTRPTAATPVPTYSRSSTFRKYLNCFLNIQIIIKMITKIKI
jgi:hypothetical protein